MMRSSALIKAWIPSCASLASILREATLRRFSVSTVSRPIRQTPDRNHRQAKKCLSRHVVIKAGMQFG